MNGLKYYRCARLLTQQELAQKAHLSRGRVAKMENEAPSGAYEHYETVARVLQVTIDELFLEFPDEDKCVLPRNIKLDPKENLYNSISHYRQERGLSFHGLSEILYCSDEAAKATCMADEAPESDVGVLARLEGLTPNGFRIIYKEGELL